MNSMGICQASSASRELCIVQLWPTPLKIVMNAALPDCRQRMNISSASSRRPSCSPQTNRAGGMSLSSATEA